MEKNQPSSSDVQEAVRAARSHRKALPNVHQKSKAEQRAEATFQKVQDEIRDSKQAVVQHINRARNLEQSLAEAAAQDKSLKALLRGKVDEKPWMLNLGEKLLWLDNQTLRRIEGLSGLSGLGYALQKTLYTYDDGELCDALDNLPPQAILSVDVKMFAKVVLAVSHARMRYQEAAEMYQLAKIIAQRELTQDPASRTLLGPKSSEKEVAMEEKRLRSLFSQIQWDVLVRMLRKRLRVIHLVLTMPMVLSPGPLIIPSARSKFAMVFKEQFNHGRLSNTSSSSNVGLIGNGTVKTTATDSKQSRLDKSTTVPPPRPSSSHQQENVNGLVPATGGPLPPAPTLTNSSNNNSSNPKSPSKKDKKSKMAADLRASYFSAAPGPTVKHTSPLRGKRMGEEEETAVRLEGEEEMSRLRQQLFFVNSRITQMSDMIATDLSEITQTVKPGLGETKADSTAMHFAKHLAMRKLETVLLAVGRRAYIEAWRRWQAVVRFVKTEDSVLVFVAYMGAHRFKRACMSIITGKVRRALGRMRENAEWYKANESFSALVEIQRVWRGAAARCFLKAARRQWAALTIQRVYRGHRCKPLIREKELARTRYRAQVTITHGWFRWKRTKLVKNRAKKRVLNYQAKQIQKMFRGWKGRKKMKHVRFLRRLNYGALKLQTLYRQYRSIVVMDALLLKRRRLRASIQIQRIIRGMIARKCADHIREKNLAATCITYAIKCYLAYKELLRRKAIKRLKIENAAALQIQRIARGMLGRKRFKYVDEIRQSFRENQKKAFDRICRLFYPVVLGFVTRKHWVPIIQAYTMRRFHAATAIKTFIVMCIRRWKLRVIAIKTVEKLRKEKFDREEKIRKDNRVRLLRLRCAIKIQANYRGYRGRLRAFERREEKEREDLINANKNRTKAYFRMQEDYWKAQNLFHRPYAIEIQRIFRGTRGRVRVVSLIRQRAAARIQKKWRDRKQIAAAQQILTSKKDIVMKEKARLAAQVSRTGDVQRVVRGFLGRRKAMKMTAIVYVRRVLERGKRLKIADTAIANYRRRKARLQLINEKAVIIQSIVRRFLGRVWFLKRYKRLMRDRISRDKKRKDKAATKIQAMIRRKLAKMIVDKRRKEVAEEKRLQEKMDELEKKLEELHSEWLEEIVVIRAQTGVRGMLGRKAFLRKSAQMIKDAEEKFLKKKNAAAVSVQVSLLARTYMLSYNNPTHTDVQQAVMRGCLSRKRFVKALPGLIHASQMRLFCVECEKKVATRRCIDCRDKYCVGCYTKLHQKGARKFHSWLPSPGLTREQRRIIQMHNPQALLEDYQMISGQEDEKDEQLNYDEVASLAASYATGGSQDSRELTTGGGMQTQRDGGGSWVSNGDMGDGQYAQGEWDEYYDDNAQAKYWYNRNTGEAQWIDPYSTGGQSYHSR